MNKNFECEEQQIQNYLEIYLVTFKLKYFIRG